MSVHKEHAGNVQEKITYSWGVYPLPEIHITSDIKEEYRTVSIC